MYGVGQIWKYTNLQGFLWESHIISCFLQLDDQIQCKGVAWYTLFLDILMPQLSKTGFDLSQVGLLHSIMSDKEYNVIVNCFYMNISEIPKLPPSFRGRTSVPKETIHMLADKVNVNSQVLLSRTVTLMTVEVSYALMELYNGFDKGSPLAHISVSFQDFTP